MFARFEATPSTTSSLVRFADPRGDTLVFEYGLFILSILGLALCGITVAFGYLNSPAASMVVGDWYLLTSGFVIVAAASSRPKLIAFVAAAAFLFAAVLYPLSRMAGLDEGLKAHIKVAVACASAIAVVTQFIFAMRQGRGWRENRDLAVGCFAVALVVVPLMSGWGIEASTHIARTLDLQALRIDEAFGMRVPAKITDLTTRSAVASYLVFHVYISASLAMVGYDLIFGDTRNWLMTKLLLVSASIGFVVYFITPVVGTNFYDSYNAEAAQHVLLEFLMTTGHDLPRNAMPSVHTTLGLFFIAAAIVRFGHSWRESVVGVLFGIYGVLTICGALVFGHHYLIDCIVALPFATAILLIVVGFESRRSSASDPIVLASIALLCCWVVVLRFGGFFSAWPVIYVLTAAGLAVFALAVARLRRATNGGGGVWPMLSSATPTPH